MTVMDEDARDIKAYMHGSMSAFHRLYTRYERPLFFYILSMVRDHHLAEDLLQDTWLQTVNKLSSFGFKGAFRNWIYTIAHHKVIDHARAASHRQAAHLEDGLGGESERTLHDVLPDHAPSVVRQASARELCEHVQRIVAAMPEEQREVFLLRTDAGMPFKEIAALQNAPLNTVLGRMHYAVTRLRAELTVLMEHEHLEPEPVGCAVER
jgi:RNA polymerase sigma-70 factor (ECF subfamily)